MSPFIAMLLGKILDYLADHADELVAAIKEHFPTAHEDEDVRNALCDLADEPTKENLETLGEKMAAAGEDTDKLAALIVDKSTATV
jgi:uncharacterized protein YqeY